MSEEVDVLLGNNNIHMLGKIGNCALRGVWNKVDAVQ